MLKMEAASVLFATLWPCVVFSLVSACPELCTCMDKHSRYIAECSFRDLSEVPVGFPPKVTTISLSVNKIRFIPVGSFSNANRLISLWLAHNELVHIERGTLASLLHLRNLDVGHNKIVDFPWEDLENLTALQLLKMNHNEMSSLPRDAFARLKDLRSLRLNNNNFVTLADGTFQGLVSLSHLQIHNNPFSCTCSMQWFRDWILASTISIPDVKLITCAIPQRLSGQPISNLTDLRCTSPEVRIRPEANVHNMYEDTDLVLTCEVKGNPKPEVMWSIHSKRSMIELPFQFVDDDSGEMTEDSMGPVTVFTDGTLLISNLRKGDSGKYSCFATNELGSAEDSVTVKVFGSSQIKETRSHSRTNPTEHQPTERMPVFHVVQTSEPDQRHSTKNVFSTLTEDGSSTTKKAKGSPSISNKCGLTANTRYVSDQTFNRSLEDIRLHTFDFGVLALGVSDTEARVRFNHRSIPKATSSGRELGDDSDEEHHLLDVSEKDRAGVLYLCATADQKHSDVQWLRVKDGIDMYLFSGLRPATNYSLCLTYQEEDCEVHVIFTTRRRVTNLLIIVSVSICLLTVSTVPLLAATCFHLVYKYRSKTYRLILKAKDQYYVERNVAVNYHVTHTKLPRKAKGSPLDEEREGDSESADGEKEGETEESVLSEPCCPSQCTVNVEDCEVESQSSDRLPLGVEAMNLPRITTQSP